MARYLSRQLGQGLVVILLISLLLPTVLATALAIMGHASGCPMIDATADTCQVSGINIGQTIKTLIDWTWNIIGFGLFSGFPIIGVAGVIGLLVLIHKSFRGWLRPVVGFLSVWYVGFAPMISGIIFVTYFASRAQCSVNEGGVGSCHLFGVDMGNTFHSAAAIPWLIFLLVPFCGLVSLVYGGIALAKLNQN